MDQMLVLVHSPLVGPDIWHGVAEVLKSRETKPESLRNADGQRSALTWVIWRHSRGQKMSQQTCCG